jgi:DDE superfamily endonuclease
MAQAVPGTRAQRWHEFFTPLPWDAEDLNRQRVAKRLAEVPRGDGVVVGDETGVPTQGTASVGVARQDAGPPGQVGHGQVAVTCCDTERPAAWPVAVRLDVPQTWADDPERRHQARVPPEGPFQRTPELALALLEQARAWGGRLAGWWPRPPTGIPRMAWRAWKPGRHRMWGRGAPTSRCGCGIRRPLGGAGGGVAPAGAPLAVAHQALAAGRQGLAAQDIGGRAAWAGAQ